jgi:hypothetical protein
METNPGMFGVPTKMAVQSPKLMPTSFLFHFDCMSIHGITELSDHVGWG